MNFIRRLATTAKQEIIQSQPLLPRLESHYFNVLYEDLMILNYDHFSPQADLNELKNHPQWNTEFNDNTVANIYSMHLDELPTKGYTTNLLTTEINKPVKTGLKKKLKNPIDYTSIPKEVFHAPPPAPETPPYSPLPYRIPQLQSIELKIWSEDAVSNKSILLAAIMSLQAISGKRAEPVFATRGDSSKKIRAGMPLGAKIKLERAEMYYFLDKMVQCVLPRIREWEGVNPKGDGAGSLEINLPASAVGTFPDIEPHFDMYPRLFDIQVKFQTTAKTDKETCLLLSGFQIPFLSKLKVEETEEKVSNDPWERIKMAKTREERKRLFAEITAAKKKAE